MSTVNETGTPKAEVVGLTTRRFGWLMAAILLIPLTMGVLYGVHRAEVAKARADYLDCRMGNAAMGADPDSCVQP